MLSALSSYARYLYRLYIRRDPFLQEVRRWFRDRGDQTLRLDYPLDKDSLVLDVGAYHGDFADAIYRRFGCRLILFEPVPDFYSICVQRFRGIDEIQIIDCGLGSEDAELPITLNDDGSGFFRRDERGRSVLAKVRRADSLFAELGIDKIDLIKINIEGGEYDLLQTLIETGWLSHIRYLQVQFHNFVSDAALRREALRKQIMKTHREMWNYDFVWESWELRP